MKAEEEANTAVGREGIRCLGDYSVVTGEGKQENCYSPVDCGGSADL